MTVIATDAARLSNLVKHELWPETGYCRKMLTVNEAAAKTYVVGTVLGFDGTDYKISVETAVDGSEVPAAVVMADYSVAATTNTQVLCLVKGPAEVSQDALALDASFDDDTKKAAAYAALEALGINVLPTV